jgi:hypothetical protein
MTKPHAPSLIQKIGIVPVNAREAVEGNDLARMAAHVEKVNKSITDDPYYIRIGGVIVDPYRIAREYGLDPIIAQAEKKLLRCGRKHKTPAQDVREAITTLLRWEAMEAEDVNNSEPV